MHKWLVGRLVGVFCAGGVKIRRLEGQNKGFVVFALAKNVLGGCKVVWVHGSLLQVGRIKRVVQRGVDDLPHHWLSSQRVGVLFVLTHAGRGNAPHHPTPSAHLERVLS